jgi:signal transduction histidine kinase
MRIEPYGYAPAYGILLPFFFAWAYTLVFLALFTLIKFHKASSSPEKKRQAALIITGVSLSLLGGGLDILRSFGLVLPPVGILGNITFGCLVALAIMRYQFLDVPHIVRKGLAYTLVSGFVVGVYVLLILLLSRVFQLEQISMVVNIMVIIGIAIALQPMLRWVQKLIDKWFYRDRYNQLRALEEFSRQTHEVSNLDHLCSSLVSLVKVALRSSSVFLLMTDGTGAGFHLAAHTSTDAPSPRPSLKKDDPVVRWLRMQDGCMSRKDMDIIPKLQAISQRERNTLNQLSMELIIPLRTTNELAGILVLGPKLSGEAYSADDKRVLTVVSRQMSTALDNARLYNEVRVALRELRKTQDQLLRTERLKAVAEVAAGVGHDLRNLLTVVLGRSQLALKRGNYDEKLRDDLKLIEEATLDGAQVLNRMQNFTKVSSAHDFVPVNLNELLLESIQMLEPRLSQKRETENANIDLILNLRDTELVKGSPSELREMLTNIVINAIEAMPRGGRLVVESEQKSSVAVITIEDTGVGMTSEVRKRIFEPFYSTKGSKGVGLGLNIARGIAKQHGGDIQVSSRLGEGSTFTIQLPVTKQKGRRNLVRSKVSGVARQALALVIDDDKRVGGVLAEILESGGYTVDVAASAKEGLALAQGKDYTVMITDLGMPGMSGRDVAKAVKAVKPEMPIFLVTGWDIEVQPSELIDLGIRGIIMKPFTRTNILTQIKNAMK